MMSSTIKRHFLRERETEQILQELSRQLREKTAQQLGLAPPIELAEIKSTQIFIVNGKPLLARLDGILSPTLVFVEIFPYLPKVIVDMGAVPYVCNGADVMAPGVVRVEGDFRERDILLVEDERHEKPLAIGVALFDSEHVGRLTEGKIVKNIHYVGDKLWDLLKRLQ
jgi:PUA domain protein